jgi:hypothetical protein
MAALLFVHLIVSDLSLVTKHHCISLLKLLNSNYLFQFIYYLGEMNDSQEKGTGQEISKPAGTDGKIFLEDFIINHNVVPSIYDLE